MKETCRKPSRCRQSRGLRRTAAVGLGVLLLALAEQRPAPTAPGEHRGGEANLQLPDLGMVSFGGINGRLLLAVGLVICLGGLLFGMVGFKGLRDLRSRSMKEMSELIYQTCKTYLVQQGKFLRCCGCSSGRSSSSTSSSSPGSASDVP